MWFWISAFIILLGAELNAELEAQTRKDTTQGRDQPMGTRDAEKADNLGHAAGK
jgi:membrane protein